ncbi:MAG: DUF47 domain-containing protein [Verrucomicrobiota bacterium]
MFSLKKLIGGEEVFFELLEKSAEEARESVDLLVQLLAKPEAGSLDDFALLRKKDKRITEEITERVTTTFVTPLEREDIEALSNALYKIPKTLEKFGERLLLCPERVRKVDFSRQAGLLLKAADVVLLMVRSLRSSPELEKVKEQNDRLQYLEGEADKLMVELLRDLYAGEKDAVSVIALKDLYDLLEKVIDRCRDSGNVIFHIVLKNS